MASSSPKLSWRTERGNPDAATIRAWLPAFAGMTRNETSPERLRGNDAVLAPPFSDRRVILRVATGEHVHVAADDRDDAAGA